MIAALPEGDAEQLHELRELLLTAGVATVGGTVQRRDHPHPNTYLGPGKLEEVKAVADEAHRLGMTVTGHVPNGLDAFQTVEAGQDQINHITYIADIMRPELPANATREDRRKAAANLDLDAPEGKKALAFLKDHHTVVDPTMALFELFTATTTKPVASFEPGVNKVPVELAQPLTDVAPPTEDSEIRDKIFRKHLQIVGLLHRAGIPVVAGTDQAVPGHSLHRDRKSTRLNSSHCALSRMPSSA